MPRRTWTDKVVAAFKPAAKVYLEADPALPGHYVRVQPGGSKSFVAMSRDPRGKQRWVTVSPTHLVSLTEARERAREIMHAVRRRRSFASHELRDGRERMVHKARVEARRPVGR